MSHITVCLCYLCLYARVLSHLCCWLLLAVRDERRKGKEGTCVSMTTHLLVALYKARRGGRERRANRYWQGTLSNKGRPMLPADSNSTSCAASKRSQHADSVRGYATQLMSITFLYCPAHSTLDQQAVRRQVAMPMNNTHPPQPTPRDMRHTHRHRGHAPASVRLDQTQSDSNQTQSEAEHIGSMKWKK